MAQHTEPPKARQNPYQERPQPAALASCVPELQLLGGAALILQQKAIQISSASIRSRVLQQDGPAAQQSASGCIGSFSNSWEPMQQDTPTPTPPEHPTSCLQTDWLPPCISQTPPKAQRHCRPTLLQCRSTTRPPADTVVPRPPHTNAAAQGAFNKLRSCRSKPSGNPKGARPLTLPDHPQQPWRQPPWERYGRCHTGRHCRQQRQPHVRHPSSLRHLQPC